MAFGRFSKPKLTLPACRKRNVCGMYACTMHARCFSFNN